MGNDVKLDNLIKSKLKEVLVENTKKQKKLFEVIDKSGRSAKPYIFSRAHIEKHWDLDEEDWDSEVTLGDFLEDSRKGDEWNTQTEKIRCFFVK
jgi:hypothetical protein